jgi:hypothetical protein
MSTPFNRIPLEGISMWTTRMSLFELLLATTILASATAHVNLITNLEDARAMSMDQLKSLFVQGTIEKGESQRSCMSANLTNVSMLPCTKHLSGIKYQGIL